MAFSADARHRLLRLHWILGLAIVVVGAAPWFLYMWFRWNGAFLEGYVLNENLRLFGQSMYANQPRWWFYFQILAAGLLPWTGVLIGRLYDDVRRAISRRDPPDTFEILLWTWTLTVVGFFSMSSFRLDHYVFPAAPSLCLLCARAWDDVRRRPMDPSNAGARAGLYVLGPLLVALGAGAGYFLIARLELPKAAIIVPVVLILAGTMVTVLQSLWLHAPPRVPWIVLGAMTITYAGIILWVMPALEHRKVVPDIARWVASRASATDRVAAYGMNRWTTAFRFYVDRHTVMLDSPEVAREFFERPEPFYCAMLGPVYEEFIAQGIPLRVVYVREGMWATSGRVLWRRRVPPARFVIVTRAP
jgi:4-amino-4-deoxy-L-arabinose transferase-like glycosyltransferase